MKYGAEPRDIGLVDINPTEMMFWMYCPIKEAQSHRLRLPQNLKQFGLVVDKVFQDMKMNDGWTHEFDNLWYNSYVYITAKTLWVQGTYIGNRPGWHSDGFGTDDLNYIWYDRAPTEFMLGDFELSDDCNESMKQMENISLNELWERKRYPDKHLLRLDSRIIHRCPVNFEPGMRTFVKISISSDHYNLEGNSINHELGDIFPNKIKRNVERNHPGGSS